MHHPEVARAGAHGLQHHIGVRLTANGRHRHVGQALQQLLHHRAAGFHLGHVHLEQHQIGLGKAVKLVGKVRHAHHAQGHELDIDNGVLQPVGEGRIGGDEVRGEFHGVSC